MSTTSPETAIVRGLGLPRITRELPRSPSKVRLEENKGEGQVWFVNWKGRTHARAASKDTVKSFPLPENVSQANRAEDRALQLVEQASIQLVTKAESQEGTLKLNTTWQDSQGKEKEGIIFFGQNSIAVVQDDNLVTLQIEKSGLSMTHVRHVYSMRPSLHTYPLGDQKLRDRVWDLCYAFDDMLVRVDEEAPHLIEDEQGASLVAYHAGMKHLVLADLRESTYQPIVLPLSPLQRFRADFTSGFNRGYADQVHHMVEAERNAHASALLENFFQQFSQGEDAAWVSGSGQYVQFECKGQHIRIYVKQDGIPLIQIGSVLGQQQDVYTLIHSLSIRSQRQITDLIDYYHTVATQRIMDFGSNLVTKDPQHTQHHWINALHLLSLLQNYYHVAPSGFARKSTSVFAVAEKRISELPSVLVQLLGKRLRKADLELDDSQKEQTIATLDNLEKFIDSLVGIIPNPERGAGEFQDVPEFLLIDQNKTMIEERPTVSVHEDFLHLSLPTANGRVKLFMNPLLQKILLQADDGKVVPLEDMLEDTPSIQQHLVHIIQQLETLFIPPLSANLEKVTYTQKFGKIREMLRMHKALVMHQPIDLQKAVVAENDANGEGGMVAYGPYDGASPPTPQLSVSATQYNREYPSSEVLVRPTDLVWLPAVHDVRMQELARQQELERKQQ